MNESNRSHTLKLTKDNIKEWKEEYDRVFSSLGIEVSHHLKWLAIKSIFICGLTVLRTRLLWKNYRAGLNDKDSLISKLATVKFFNLTPGGVPRFPHVISIRDYE